MPRNSSGIYTAPANSVNPAIPDTEINATDFNAMLTDLSEALSESIASDGVTTVTANIPMAGFKLTGVGLATTLGDALSYGRAATVPVATIAATSDGSPAQIYYNGQTTRRNWTVGNQINVNDAYEITPSTIAGGSTYTTPALSIVGATKAATFAGTVSATTFNSSTLAVRTRQVLTSGTAATYTTPAGVRQILVRAWGAGGGGGGSSATVGDQGAGGTGGTTSFNSVTAVGGTGSGGGGGVGGTGGTGTASFRMAGAPGAPAAIYLSGAATYFQFGGNGGGVGGGHTTTIAGVAGAANTGGGGSGAGLGSIAFGASNAGGGGGAGEYMEILINSPSATYTYTVGAGGTAGTAGTAGNAGGAGGTGLIIVDEFY